MFLTLLQVWTALAQDPTGQPLAQRCTTPSLQTGSSVACINRYAAVLPEPFARAASTNGEENVMDTFAQTNVSDSSFDIVHTADFLVFDQDRGAQILGSAPVLDFIFTTRNDSVHEAPVYIPPPLNAIIYSLPHQGIYEQQIISLNANPPTIAN